MGYPHPSGHCRCFFYLSPMLSYLLVREKFGNKLRGFVSVFFFLLALTTVILLIFLAVESILIIALVVLTYAGLILAASAIMQGIYAIGILQVSNDGLVVKPDAMPTAKIAFTEVNRVEVKPGLSRFIFTRSFPKTRLIRVEMKSGEELFFQIIPAQYTYIDLYALLGQAAQLHNVKVKVWTDAYNGFGFQEEEE